ncbi:DUF1456 family protein [Silvimonas iriomotensis]|uniref:DUF1456 family protein n=1 Tax=Silvimonas iriomotensis TaxID=449662 RepID=A0ABQ2P6H1_9NEIS|nr:DUF1456 family protein [Silvimonas iriomotensis]GGP19026.1 hypothetical protein GCM10010970_08570 [Silvimonas iriomotensis]
MNHNDILRGVRYMLDLSEPQLAAIFDLGGMKVTLDKVALWLLKEDEADFTPCPDLPMAHFLNGLVIYRRGRDDTRPPQQIESSVTNNIVLKKLRVAFELKEEDMHAVLKLAGFEVSRPELSALFRKEGQKNYRACGDQLLRNFMRGLTQWVRNQPQAAARPAED